MGPEQEKEFLRDARDKNSSSNKLPWLHPAQCSAEASNSTNKCINLTHFRVAQIVPIATLAQFKQRSSGQVIPALGPDVTCK